MCAELYKETPARRENELVLAGRCAKSRSAGKQEDDKVFQKASIPVNPCGVIYLVIAQILPPGALRLCQVTVFFSIQFKVVPFVERRSLIDHAGNVSLTRSPDGVKGSYHAGAVHAPPADRPSRCGRARTPHAAVTPVGSSGAGIIHGFVPGDWFRKAASPASDTSTHFLSGAASET